MSFAHRSWLVASAGAVALLAFACLSRGPVVASEAAQTPPASAGGSFEGKVVMIFLKGDKKPDGVFENPHFETVGGRTFLVGRELGDDKLKGLRLWLPAEDVQMLVEFKNFEEVKERQSHPSGNDHPAPQKSAPDGKL